MLNTLYVCQSRSQSYEQVLGLEPSTSGLTLLAGVFPLPRAVFGAPVPYYLIATIYYLPDY